jgi:hypothetical protein
MTFSLLISQRGWVSLPIIALLLAVSTLSTRYQETLLATYKWRGQLNDVEENQQIWVDFYTDVIASPAFHLATLGDCVGFCGLLEQQDSYQEQVWTQGDQTLNYQWSRYELSLEEKSDEAGSSSESENKQTSYRLCATQNQQAYLCWWWRDGKLLSNGWLSVH